MILKECFKDWSKVVDLRVLLPILNQLEKEYKTKSIIPNQSDVFKAFTSCDYNNLKVILLAQDPYPQLSIATGIAFGNKPETKTLSPSLQVIKESLCDGSYYSYVEFDSTLESWCKQGILLLNSALTVEENKIGSHTMLWRPFIANLIQNVSIANPGIIYLLLGEQAKTFKPYILKDSGYIIEEKHPSYYARINERMSNRVFCEINNILKTNNNLKINWNESINEDDLV